MPKTNELVSIILPCFNVGKYLDEALCSILESTYSNFELIAVNDGSQDDTYDILKKYSQIDNRIRIIDRKQNKGLIYTLNEGIKYSQSEIIIRFDPDDILLKYTIGMQVEMLNNGYDFVFGNAIIVDEDGNEFGSTVIHKCSRVLNDLPFINKILHNTVAFKKNLIIKYGFYNQNCIGFEDQELWHRFHKNNITFFYINKSLVKYRISFNSCQQRDYSDYYFLIAKYLLNHSNKRAAFLLFSKIKKPQNKFILMIRIFIPECCFKILNKIRMKLFYKKINGIYRPLK